MSGLRERTDNRDNRVLLFTLSGVFTAPGFLDEFRRMMAERLTERGYDVAAAPLFPYGDWLRSRARQSAEIAADLCGLAIGGRRAAAAVTEAAGGALSESGDGGGGRRRPAVVLIGHSGGGVAAVHAAARLLTAPPAVRVTVGAVALIGSPRVPVPAPLRPVTAYFYATDKEGRRSDRIAAFGSWQGGRPAGERGIVLVGSHKDYFRSLPPFVNEEGASNVTKTREAVMAWMNSVLPDPADGRAGL